MTICFIGNSFKYETEAVMKLFLPLVTFDFLFEETADNGDVCIVGRTPSDNGYTLSVSVTLDGKTESETAAAKGDYSDKEDEAELCRMLYRIMRKLTGITPAC